MNVFRIAAVFVLLPIVTAAAAQFPGKPIRIVNPFAAGGRIGYDAGAKAPPDGYTLVVTDTTYTMMPALYKTLP